MTPAFETLSVSLRNVLAEAKFDLGRVTSEHPRITSYTNRPGEVVGPEHLRKVLAGESSRHEDPRQARSARVSIREALESDLRDSLRHALEHVHDPGSDCLGHAFPMGGDRHNSSKTGPSRVSTRSNVSSVDQFSATITKWAAVCGVDPVVDLLEGCARGEPFAYRTRAVIGLTLEEPLRLAEGVRITPLPLSTAELPDGLPKRNDIRRSGYLGHAILSIDTFAKPALFRPGAGRKHAVRGYLVQDLDFDLVLQALSLECDAGIEMGFGWVDYGELSVLTSSRTSWGSLTELGHPVGRHSSSINHSTGVTTIKLHEGAVQSPSEAAIQALLKALRSADARTRVAVSRWKESKKQRASLTDAFIDLRIALESLFLPQTPDQQLKFRLAANGAWLVGRDGPDRRRSWRILRAAYDAASKAVHRGEVKRHRKNNELLASAQEVCRRGIMRALRDGPVTDWDGLILDAPRQNPR
ncbi:MAG: hypothetical protein OXN92_17000 [Gammaproteobacteria bacterium]|nr:hypothetical protein [Gammaproteobacteria bacterium]